MDFKESQAHSFAVCRMSVLWRVVLGVQMPVALGAMFLAPSPEGALQRWAQGAAVALPATLVWLLGACWMGDRWLRWPSGMQVVAAWCMGVAAVALGGSPVYWLAWIWQTGEFTWWTWVPPLTSGAVMSMVAMAWLRSRVLAQAPTDAQARLDELQARIRPHFLFNTLNSAIALVQLDPQRAQQVLEDLAELFHEALKAPRGLASLGHELALSRRYLDIEGLRFGERMQVIWTLDATLNDTELPALVLQPLVENAVRHGVEPAVAGGWIQVDVRPEGGHTQVTVTNSLPDVGQAIESPGHGMALDNVRDRLRLMFDLDASLTVGERHDPVRGRMFEACLRVPQWAGSKP